MKLSNAFHTSFFPGRELPVVVKPADKGLNVADYIGLLRAEVDALRHNWTKFGGLLLRDFPFRTTDNFEALLDGLKLDLMPYVGGVGLRGDPLQGQIYKSTKFPAHLDLHVHNEATYSKGYAGTLAFYCLVPSEMGGETPLADSRKVYNRIRPELREKFEEKGLTYIRYLPKDKGKYLVGWPEIFDSPEAVDAHCKAKGIEYEWLPEEILVLKEKMLAVIPHRTTGEPCWLNQVTIFHPSFWSKQIKVIPEGQPPETYPTGIAYGDGSAIDEADVWEIEEAWQAEYTQFRWQQGDVLFVDNEAVAHGRRPFSGAREIRIALMAE